MSHQAGFEAWEDQIEWDATRRMQFAGVAEQVKFEMSQESVAKAQRKKSIERVNRLLKNLDDLDKEGDLEEKDLREWGHEQARVRAVRSRRQMAEPVTPRKHATRGSGITPSVSNLFGLNDKKPRTAAGESSGAGSSSKKAGSNIKNARGDSSKGRSGGRKRASKGGVAIDGQSERGATTRDTHDTRPFPGKPVGASYRKPEKGANPLMGSFSSKLLDDDILADITMLKETNLAMVTETDLPEDPPGCATAAVGEGLPDLGDETCKTKRKRVTEEFGSDFDSAGVVHGAGDGRLPSSRSGAFGESAGSNGGEGDDASGRGGATGGAKAKRTKVDGAPTEDGHGTARADGGRKKRPREEDGMEGTGAREGRESHEGQSAKRARGDSDGGADDCGSAERANVSGIPIDDDEAGRASDGSGDDGLEGARAGEGRDSHGGQSTKRARE